MTSIRELLEEHHIQYRVRADWYNVCCPFCYGDTGFHLGISDKGFATCFKCGWHSIESTLHALIDCGYVTAKHYAKTICKGKSLEVDEPKTIKFELPYDDDITTGGGIARQYLQDRLGQYHGFHLHTLLKDYDIRFTKFEYKDAMLAGRIVFPNYYHGKAVSWQARDYLNIHSAKYITAPKDGEIIFHKNFLWGIDKVPYDKVIVCEGVMDALTIGEGAVHTHGVKFSHAQVGELMGFKEVYICYDSDEAGMLGARRLASCLSHRTNVKIVKISCKDVNSCSKQEVEDLKGLIK
jgi:5S rRNA maturation endonuclease (ribonuclease M5)